MARIMDIRDTERLAMVEHPPVETILLRHKFIELRATRRGNRVLSDDP
jgi:hypothetical protein